MESSPLQVLDRAGVPSVVSVLVLCGQRTYDPLPHFSPGVFKKCGVTSIMGDHTFSLFGATYCEGNQRSVNVNDRGHVLRIKTKRECLNNRIAPPYFLVGSPLVLRATDSS